MEHSDSSIHIYSRIFISLFFGEPTFMKKGWLDRAIVPDNFQCRRTKPIVRIGVGWVFFFFFCLSFLLSFFLSLGDDPIY